MIKEIYKSEAINRLRKTKIEIEHKTRNIIRVVTRRSELNKIVNEKEIRVVGLKRSGNHAIINWIRKQFPEYILFLNNIPCGTNPYRSLSQHYHTEHLKQQALGNFTYKECLIYSHEDYSLEQVVNPEFENNHDLYIGKSAIRYDLIILRDPFNMVASRLNSQKQGITSFARVKAANKTYIDLWIEYAREYLGETNYLENNKLCINYNQWFLSQDYRREIADKLQIDFTDRGIDEVKSQGGGSSFDGRNLDGQAMQMDVMNRWVQLADNPIYRQLLDNEELLRYSQRIFGSLPGTESWLRSLGKKL